MLLNMAPKVGVTSVDARAHQRLQERGPRRGVLRQELARFLGAVHQDGARLRQRDGLAAGPFAIDQHRDLAERIEREELRRLVLALVERDRVQLVGQGAFLERDARAHPVRSSCCVQFDHVKFLNLWSAQVYCGE
jgi:hypothetical protein